MKNLNTYLIFGLKSLIVTTAMIFISVCVNAQQWNQTSLNGGDIYSFATTGDSIFAGTNYVVYLSTDDGTTWNPVGDSLPFVAYNKPITAITSSNGKVFASTEYNDGTGSIFLLTDTGWTSVSTGILSDNSINALVSNGTNIYAGFDGGVYLSTNNGASWTSIDSGMTYKADSLGHTVLAPYPVASLAASGTNVFAGTYSGQIFLTNNNGVSWQERDSGIPYSTIFSIVINGTKVYAGTDSGIFLSSDSGKSWNPINGTISNRYVLSIALSTTKDTVFIATQDAGVYLSTNNGNSWKAINNGFPVTDFILNLCVSGQTIFAGTVGSGVWKYSKNALAVENISESTTDFNVYPNPASNQLTIHTASIHPNEAVTVSIMNMLGETMQEEKMQWSNDASINVKNLMAGIYFVQLQIENCRWVEKFIKE